MTVPRIALVFEFRTLNGGERSMLAVLDELLGRHRAEFVAIAPCGGALARELAVRNVPHIPFDSARGATGHASREEKLARLRDAIEMANADLVHANSLSMGRLLGALAASLTARTTAHLRDIVRLSRAAAVDVNGNAGLVAVSQATKDYHVRQGVGPDHICVIHNGVDLDRFRPRPATGILKRELGLPAGSVIALNAGQICLRKGHDVLARAAVLLRDEFPELHWVICGERYSAKPESIAFEQDFHRVFADAGLSTRLHCLGYRDDMPRLLNEADVLVHAARQEPFGRVLLEAAASGLPTVATRVGGTEEIIGHEISGWLVSPDDPMQLAAAVRLMLDSPGRRGEYAAAARRHVEARFAAQTAAENLWRWWEGVFLGNDGPGGRRSSGNRV